MSHYRPGVAYRSLDAFNAKQRKSDAHLGAYSADSPGQT